MRRQTRFTVLALTMALLAAACSSNGNTTPANETAQQQTTTSAHDAQDSEPVAGGALIFAVETETDGYNPVNNRWSYAGNLIGSAVYEPLMRVTEERDVEPWLAESVEPNEDGTVWTVTPREGVTFHDGTALDAEVIAANIRARSEGLLTAMANEPVESAEATDDGTVVVTMKRPWAQWDKTLATQSGFMMSLANIDDPGADPIGTGPFSWVEHKKDELVVVDRFDDYWGGPAHLDRITFRIVVDPDTRISALRSGDVDAIMTQSAPSIAAMRDSEFTVIEDAQGDTAVVMLNAATPPFDNPTARAAVTAATDPEALIDLRYDGLVEAAQGPFAPDEMWFTEDNGYVGSDPIGAVALVRQYEEETGGPLRVILKGSRGDETEQNMIVLQEQWNAAGIQTELDLVEQAAVISQIVGGNYEAAMFRNFSWADPDFDYIFFHSDNARGPGEVSVNFTHTKNDDLDAALVAGREFFDDEPRKEAYGAVQRILNEEHAYVWLFHNLGAIISLSNVHGWEQAEARGFYRQDAKTWWQDLWIEG